MTTTTADQASHEVEQALDSKWLQWVGRAGWLAKGIIYGVFGLIAFRIATGTSDAEADPSGAVHQIAAQGPGRILLIALGVGLALYALWRLACAALPGEWGPTDLAKRGGYVASGLVYGVLCATTFSLVAAGSQSQGGGESTDSRVQQLTADLLGQSWGRWLVGIGGLAVIAVGAAFAVYGLKRKDEKQLDHARMGSTVRKAVHYFGPVGWLARALVTAFVGIFLVQAAWNYDAEQAQGFDGALRQAASGGWVWLVAATGAGLVIYGAYCLVTAPYRVLQAP